MLVGVLHAGLDIYILRGCKRQNQQHRKSTRESVINIYVWMCECMEGLLVAKGDKIGN